MRKLFSIALVTLLGCNNQPVVEKKPTPVVTCPKNVEWEAHFSPNGYTTVNLVANLNHAKQSIRVQAYSFTSVPIAEALIQAHSRKVFVEVVVDKSQKTAKGTVVPLLVRSGIPVFVDEKHAIAHNKVIIIDKETVFTGSFNFTNAAEHNNAENSIRLKDAEIANLYLKNYDVHKEHSLAANE